MRIRRRAPATAWPSPLSPSHQTWPPCPQAPRGSRRGTSPGSIAPRKPSLQSAARRSRAGACRCRARAADRGPRRPRTAGLRSLPRSRSPRGRLPRPGGRPSQGSPAAPAGARAPRRSAAHRREAPAARPRVPCIAQALPPGGLLSRLRTRAARPAPAGPGVRRARARRRARFPRRRSRRHTTHRGSCAAPRRARPGAPAAG